MPNMLYVRMVRWSVQNFVSPMLFHIIATTSRSVWSPMRRTPVLACSSLLLLVLTKTLWSGRCNWKCAEQLCLTTAIRLMNAIYLMGLFTLMEDSAALMMCCADSRIQGISFSTMRL